MNKIHKFEIEIFNKLKFKDDFNYFLIKISPFTIQNDIKCDDHPIYLFKHQLEIYEKYRIQSANIQIESKNDICSYSSTNNDLKLSNLRNIVCKNDKNLTLINSDYGMYSTNEEKESLVLYIWGLKTEQYKILVKKKIEIISRFNIFN